MRSLPAIIRTTCIVVAPALFVSCTGGAHNFKEVPASQPHATFKTARVVKHPLPYVASFTGVLEIDGKEPAFMRWDDTFRVTPGQHVVGLQNYGQTHTGLATVIFKAEQGKTYQAKSDAVGMKIKFWIEEQDTKRAVGGAEAPRQAVTTIPSAPIFIPIPAN
jgi:hypothetical protein